MLKVRMNDMTTRVQGTRVVVPGGWIAFIPEVSLTEADLAVYVAAVLDDYGRDVVRARDAVRALIATEFAKCRVRNLRQSVLYWARKYATIAPDLVSGPRAAHKGACVLVGFDPSEVQSCFMPDSNVGRRGKPYAERMLREMAQRARRASA